MPIKLWRSRRWCVTEGESLENLTLTHPHPRPLPPTRRQVIRQVHPDLFADSPYEKQCNSESLKVGRWP